MSLNLRYPNITARTEREQIAQLKSYLYQLVEQLNNSTALDSGTQQMQSTVTYTVQGTEVSYYELRSMIVQQIETLNNQFDELLEGLTDKVTDAVEEAVRSGAFSGADGVSVTHEWDGTVLTVTSASGTSSADLKGPQGEPGEQGPQGEPGEDGYTPQKGVDYYTEGDKQEIISAVLAALAAGEQQESYE